MILTCKVLGRKYTRVGLRIMGRDHLVDRQRVTKTCPEEVIIINPGAAHAQTGSELCPLLHVALGLSLPFPSCS